jgi:hypothetical protein
MMITSDPNGRLRRVGLRVKYNRTGLRYTYIAGQDRSNNLPVKQVRMAIDCTPAAWSRTFAISPTWTQKPMVWYTSDIEVCCSTKRVTTWGPHAYFRDAVEEEFLGGNAAP